MKTDLFQSCGHCWISQICWFWLTHLWLFFTGWTVAVSHWLKFGCFSLAHLWLFLIDWTVAVSHWLKFGCFSLAHLWLFLISWIFTLYCLRCGCFQIIKGVLQGCILSPCLFNLYAEYIIQNAGLDEAQAGIKIAGRNINNLRYADDTTLMAESEEELKSLLVKVKVESEKNWLKTQHSKN